MTHHTDLIASSANSENTLLTILNSLDALVYVSDMETSELIFLNDYGRKVWGDPGDKLCW